MKTTNFKLKSNRVMLDVVNVTDIITRLVIMNSKGKVLDLIELDGSSKYFKNIGCYQNRIIKIISMSGLNFSFDDTCLDRILFNLK